MRIIGGKYRGRFFIPDKKFNARPTTDQAKEALFNILSNWYSYSDMKVLDLFSGSGSIGYEFISRGVNEVTFVEKNYAHIQFIKKVTSELKMNNNSQIFRDEVFRFLKKCTDRFDLIFADPPYDLKQLSEIPNAVLKNDILQHKGILILEHPEKYSFSDHPHFSESRKYGKVNFSFFR